MLKYKTTYPSNLPLNNNEEDISLAASNNNNKRIKSKLIDTTGNDKNVDIDQQRATTSDSTI